ncbi:MAG: hypothetical protein AVDCRST_MAG31-230 [uncultured Sphingomonas sp.]|uniref:Flagellar biosynthesis protein FlgN n=1 Tax=uncultured Sphingomonas sp. TaxID=158754 RepID=A0A6J4SNA7_9SPHN|nr:flagellar biosynthesis protein FlgN [uncultured Sphingomonas sp.]CAA9498771.1 MAG: hypothetical protein AVDCRST_MAG31-230 [uncultured Sphingomonas sp.]
MTEALREVIGSLVAVMRDETALLQAGRSAEVRELAAAKLKLTARLEKLVAEAGREDANWRERMLEADSGLAALVRELQVAAAENGRMLQRRIELSRELLDAIAAEAKRLGGNRSETYAATGGVRRTELPAPISINASL